MKSKIILVTLLTLLIFCSLPIVPFAAVEQESGNTTLTMQYDDRYSFSKLFPGMYIVNITSVNISSYKVSGGEVTNVKDDNVIKLKANSQTDVIATGVGEATVILSEKSNADAVLHAIETGENEQRLSKLGAVKVSVKVEPAVLTLMFLFGQSNAEGNCSESGGYHTEDSIACKNGTVYSTYAPRNIFNAKAITGIDSLKACTSLNYKEFVAGSLTGEKSLANKTLLYPLNSLTSSGNGKTGPDSGLAYQWNKLSGDKVWIVNAAFGGSSVVNWVQGGSLYKRALNVSKCVVKTASAEIKAGHFTEGKRLLFWLHGESDKAMSEYEYQAFFDDAVRGFKSELKYDKFGIISVRAASSSHSGSGEKYMTGPRLAQYYYASNAAYKDVYIVSNVNEKWISDSGVSSYFNSEYPTGKLTYPLRKGATISAVPKKVSAINTDIHFKQVAHNENGITAAENMYYIFNRPQNVASRVVFMNEKGSYISSAEIKVEQRFVAVPVVYPLYCSKDYTYTTGANSAYTCGTVVGQSAGKSTFKATASSGAVFTLSIGVSRLATPVISLAKVNGGVRISWNTVKYATRYAVAKKNSDGTWSFIGKTLSTAYTDKNVKSNNSYSYKVICICSDGFSAASAYSSIKTIKYIASPAISEMKNVSAGVSLKWQKSAGAVNYRVFRRTSDSSWQRLADTASNSYTDKSTKSGTGYYYCIRCISKDGKTYISGVGTEKKIVALKSGEISKLSNVANGIAVSWKKVSGASGYVVYRKALNGSYKKIATIKSGSTLTYTDTEVKSSNGKAYYYAVKAYNGSFTGSYTAKKAVRLVAPKISSSTRTSASKATVNWKKVSGASSYQILLKSGNSSQLLTLNGESSTTIYLSGLLKGTDYKVYVRYCKTVSGVKSYSAWSLSKTI